MIKALKKLQLSIRHLIKGKSHYDRFQLEQHF